jgi:hypothetical protein
VAEKKAGASKATTAASSQRKVGEWSEAAVRVFRKRYLVRDEKGAVFEMPDDMLQDEGDRSVCAVPCEGLLSRPQHTLRRKHPGVVGRSDRRLVA